MATGKALNGKPYAGNPHVRFDEGEVAPAATPRRGSLLYKDTTKLAKTSVKCGGQLICLLAAMSAFAAFADAAAATAQNVKLDVLWCEASGAQYIDTGIIGRANTVIEAKYQWSNIKDTRIIGAWNGSNSFSFTTGSNGEMYFNVGGGNTKLDGIYEANTDYTLVADVQSQTQTYTVTCPSGTYTATVSKTATSTSPRTLFLFAQNQNGGGPVGSSRSRIYYFRIKQDGVLVRDYLPACSNNVYGMWEDVQGRFYPSATSTAFLPAPRVVDGEPDYYAQWIASDGGSWMNSGVLGRPHTKVEARFRWTTAVTGNTGMSLLGCWNNGPQFHPTFWNGTTGRMEMTAGTQHYYFTGNFEVGRDYTVVSDIQDGAQTLTVDGAIVGTTNGAVTDVGIPMYLFSQNNNNVQSAGGNNARARLYSMKIWQGNMDAPVRDFVPGVKNGEGCLYDRVSGKCFLSYGGTISSATGMVGPPAGTPAYPAYKLSYLGTEAGTYLDTGVIGRGHTKAEISFRCPKSIVTLVGSHNTTLDTPALGQCRFVMLGTRDDNTLQAALGYWFLTTDRSTTVAANTDYTVIADFGFAGNDNHQVIKLNGQTVHDGTQTMYDTQLPMYIGGLNQDGGLAGGCAVRIYYAKFWQDGRLVRHYVPVIADNGGPYFYDKVTKTFHQGGAGGLWDVGERGEKYVRGTYILIR